MSSNPFKQPTLVEMLNAIMQNKEAKNSSPRTSTTPATSPAIPPHDNRKRSLNIPKQGATERVLGSRKRPRGQLNIRDMLHVPSDSSSSNVNSTDEYAEFIRPLARPNHRSSTAASAVDNTYYIELSDSSDIPPIQPIEVNSPPLKDAPDKAIITSDITICGQTISSDLLPASLLALKQAEAKNTFGKDSTFVTPTDHSTREINLEPILIPIRDFTTVNNILNNLIKDSYTATSIPSGYVVHCKDAISHNILYQHLCTKQSKQNSSLTKNTTQSQLRLIIRKLNQTTPPIWIHKQLTNLGYDVAQVKLLKNSARGKRLNIFTAKLDNYDEAVIKSITTMKILANHSISIEIYNPIKSTAHQLNSVTDNSNFRHNPLPLQTHSNYTHKMLPKQHNIPAANPPEHRRSDKNAARPNNTNNSIKKLTNTLQSIIQSIHNTQTKHAPPSNHAYKPQQQQNATIVKHN